MTDTPRRWLALPVSPLLSGVMRAYRPLTREHEYDLAIRSRGGDRRARDLLVSHNVALVLSVCSGMRLGNRHEDAVQEGMIGLCRAADKFEPARGYRFGTYALWWIRAFVTKFARETGSIIKTPVSEPGAPVPTMCDVSLNVPLGEDGREYLDALEDDACMEDSILATELQAGVRAAMKRIRGRLGAIGAEIVTRRLIAEEATLEDIGIQFGVSREQARQVEIEVMEVLRDRLADVADTAAARQQAEDSRRAAEQRVEERRAYQTKRRNLRKTRTI